VRATLHRLFIDAADTSLRKEDEQKSRELSGILARLARLKKGAHVVDAAAGKASVGLVAAELLPLGSLTVIERDPARIAACASAAARLQHGVRVDLRHGDLANRALWPEAPDAVVALHACGGASDLVIDGAIASRAGRVFVAPCCHDESLLSRARSYAGVPAWIEAADEPIRRRILTALVDLERALRLEVAGYETRVEEFVAPTVTPQNIVLCARRTGSEVRMARARERLAALRR
jgi:precorrin-6B methylase 2